MPRSKNPNLKKPNQQLEYTYDQLVEMKQCVDDPVYFIKKYVKIQHPTKGIIDFELRPYQVKMIRGYQHNRFTVVLAARQTGKALAIDTLIPTPIGWTTMGEIQVGDYILGDDGNPVQVEAISSIMENHTCYEVKFDTGDIIVADADHLWEVYDEQDHITKIITTQQINDNKNKTQFTIKTATALNLSTKQLDVDPYLLGFLLGSGNNQYSFIPIEYKRSSFEQRLSVLQGIMDNNGTVNEFNAEQCEVILSTELLANDVYELIASLGLIPTIHNDVNHNTWKICFKVYRSNIEVFRVKHKLDLMKQVPTLLQNSIANNRRTIQSITKVKSVPVKCIRVANKNHLFLVGRAMIPTHNSVAVAAYLLWFAIFHFDKTILIASNKNTNAMEMIHRIRLGYENLPVWLKPGVLDDGWNKHSVGFDNGTRIISEATSESSGRGLSISLLYLDEFAFVPANIQEEFWTSISPTLSTGGQCIMTSTPNGDMNIFAQIWRGAQVDANGFFPVRVKWDEPPGRDEEFKKDETGRIGERKWLQEYECEFLSSDALLINSMILAQLTPIVEKKVLNKVVRDVKFWEPIRKGATYLVGIDPSTGTGKDYSVISVYEFPALIQVAEYRSNTMSTNALYEVLKNILLHLEEFQTIVYFSIENNGVGEGVISLYESDESAPPNSIFISETDKRGMTTTSKTKLKACVNLRELLEKGSIHISSRVLLAELKSFTRKRSSYSAMPGSTDDCVAATLIVIRLIQEIATYDQSAFDKLYVGNHERWDFSGRSNDENDEDDADPLPISI